MKKKLDCRMFTDDAELWDFVKLVGKVGTKFKIASDKEDAITEALLAIGKEARERGENPNSIENLEKAVSMLKTELSEYLEFKVYDESSDGWVVEGA